MTVLHRYDAFRIAFAKPPIVVSASLTFNPGSGGNDSIDVGAGTFSDLSIGGGMSLGITGSSSNDFGALKIERFDVTNTTAILTVAGVLTAEGPVTVDIEARYLDLMFLPQWPGPQGLGADPSLMRVNGFNQGIAVTSGVPFGGGTMVLTANGGAADASFGVDEYDWYLSQRTDDGDKQFLTMLNRPAAGGQSYSGTVHITATSLSEAEINADFSASTPSVTEEERSRLLKFCHLYCRRRSDGAIQWTDLLMAMSNVA